MNARRIGAILTPQGVNYCVWAPLAHTVQVMIPTAGEARVLDMVRDGHGYHRVRDPQGQPNDRYGFLVNGAGPIPDPASRGQADHISGWSVVVDPSAYRWNDRTWRRPSFRDLVIYELHVGTFTPEGTFQAAAGRLEDLRALGVNAIEILPVADFPGQRGWGYDGVLLYAPARCYGSPDDFRSLIDRAHQSGIAVILDVVYNHFGPAGNILGKFSPYYFSETHQTPWGAGFNFDGKHCRPVRDFFLGNVRYWMKEFHIDGFRLDATHEIRDDSSPSLLADIAATAHERGRYVIAEDPRNDRRLIAPAGEGCGLDAVWADDFHHVVRVSQTRERFGYYANFAGTAEELAAILQQGWLYTGQMESSTGQSRGTPAGDRQPHQFVYCVSNHDQTGNHALGRRLHQLITPEAYRTLSALICMTPGTPLLFMGQEWGASSPFLYFTDHDAELGKLVTEGRRKEFSSFPEFSQEKGRRAIPDPQAEETFTASKLDWAERAESPHAELLELYRACLHLRHTENAFRPTGRHTWKVEIWGQQALAIELQGDQRFLVLFDLWGGSSGTARAHWDVIISTNETRFGGNGEALYNEKTGHWSFTRPGLVVLRAS